MTMRRILAAIAVLMLGCFCGPYSASAGDQGCPLLVTVDDLPIAAGGLHPDPAGRQRITAGLLEALARHNIRAVGLVTWRNISRDGDVELLEQWLAAGHELGNHSTSHPDYNSTGAEDYIADMEEARQHLVPFLEQRGSELRFFRFPMLREGDTPEKLEAMRSYLRRTGQRNLPVTIDNSDYEFSRRWVKAGQAGDQAARERIVEQYHETLHLAVRHHRNQAGQLFGRDVPQVLLLHANAIGAGQWDRLFSWLEGEGFRFAAADEVLADPAYDEAHDYIGLRGLSLWDRLLDRDRRLEARRDVAKLIAQQAAAWNRGDLETFTSCYHEDAVFISSSGLTSGREELLQRYRRRYPDRQAMGHLTLEILEIHLLSGIEVSVLGDSRPGAIHGLSVAARWSLSGMSGAGDSGEERAPDTSGMTLLVFQKCKGKWEIVHDASF
jgi:peptidoglycan/xylan/chitin deacetylase (PgdA/CDA1 family)/ketosteroid isomerase-like protein